MAIFRQLLTYRNLRTALDFASTYINAIAYRFDPKIHLFESKTLSIPRYFPFAMSMFAPPPFVCSTSKNKH
jgi:hypothetical protein